MYHYWMINMMFHTNHYIWTFNNILIYLFTILLIIAIVLSILDLNKTTKNFLYESRNF